MREDRGTQGCPGAGAGRVAAGAGWGLAGADGAAGAHGSGGGYCRLQDYESQRARQDRGRGAQPPRRAPTCRCRRWARGAEGRAAGEQRWARGAEAAGGEGQLYGGVRRRTGAGAVAGRAAGACPPGPGRAVAPQCSAHCGEVRCEAEREARWRGAEHPRRGVPAGSQPITPHPSYPTHRIAPRVRGLRRAALGLCKAAALAPAAAYGPRLRGVRSASPVAAALFAVARLARGAAGTGSDVLHP